MMNQPMMKEIKLPSGNIIRFHEAGFEEQQPLILAIIGKIKGIQIDFDNEFDINFVKDILSSIISDPEINNLLWPCLGRCLLNGQNVTKELFNNNPEYKQDYLPCLLEVGIENISPFLSSLPAVLSSITEKIEKLAQEPSLNKIPQ